MEKSNKPKPGFDKYIRYSGLAFQMIATLILLGWIGIKVDKHIQLQYPIFTLVGLLLGVVLSIYILIRQLSKGEK